MSDARPRALMILNPAARHGTGRRRWAAVASLVEARTHPTLLETDRDGRWRDGIRKALDDGVRLFIAAGGDGTVGAVAGELVESRGPIPLEQLTLGAVGLGSSNDFHKPMRWVVGDVPMRIDMSRVDRRDVVRVRYVDELGAARVRYFIVSASLGVTADANDFFNEGDVVLRALKRRAVGPAIGWAALRTIAKHRPSRGRMTLDGVRHDVVWSNLSLMKTPWLSGAFHYDTPVAPDSGVFAVNLVAGAGRFSLLWTLAALLRGRFTGRPGTRHWMTTAIHIECADIARLELDGEVVRCRELSVDVLHERLSVCH